MYNNLWDVGRVDLEGKVTPNTLNVGEIRPTLSWKIQGHAHQNEVGSREEAVFHWFTYSEPHKCSALNLTNETPRWRRKLGAFG